MGIIAPLKVGYKTIILEKLLAVLDVEGGYGCAVEYQNKMARGTAGIDYGGNAALLDIMIILAEI